MSDRTRLHTPSVRLFLFRSAVALGFLVASASAEAAQVTTGTIRVDVVEAGSPVAGATVSAGGQSATTDAAGIATLTLPAGTVSVVATKSGYRSATARVAVVAGAERTAHLVLAPDAQEPGPTIESTRAGRTIENQAVPITVVDRDTIEASMLRASGDLLRLFNGTPGLRLVNTSPELGTTMARIQGLPGQYTRVLSDGVPLYFDHPGGLAMVQTPTMDLSQVEIIKGGASAIFGENALSGVVNLISRRPGQQRNGEFLLNQSTEDATDAVFWLAGPSTGPSRTWSHTFLASAHNQNERDVDGDDWSDIPRHRRIVARERVFYDNGKGKTYAGTAGVTFEKREGGSAGAHQTLETKGADGTLSGQRPLGRYILSGIGSLFVKSRTRVLSDAREEERWEAATIELSLRGNATRHTWVAGIGSDWYALRSNDETPAKYSSTRPTMFFHDEMTVTPWLLASGSLRFDHDITYGFYVSPRGSVLVREGPWAARITGGRSYFAPRPLTEETEAAGLARLTIAGPSDVEVSTANNVSGDFSHTTRSTSLMLMVFRSRVDHPAQIDRSTYTLRTGAEPMVVRGVEILGTVRRAPVSLTGSYTFLKTRQRGDEEIARNPRHSGGFVAALESSRGRIGVEFLFTGEQRLDNNPYRTVSESYSLVGLLGEYRFGRWRVFVNADNLTDVRQTDWDPIVRPARDVDGRWTVDAWAPLYGRVINAGFRVSF